MYRVLPDEWDWESLGTHTERERRFKCVKRNGVKTEAVEWMAEERSPPTPTPLSTPPYRADSLTALHRERKKPSRRKRGGRRSHVRVFQVFIDAGRCGEGG